MSIRSFRWQCRGCDKWIAAGTHHNKHDKCNDPHPKDLPPRRLGNTSAGCWERAEQWMRDHGYWTRGDGSWASGPGHEIDACSVLAEYIENVDEQEKEKALKDD